MTDITRQFALICAKEHLDTLITDYIIFGINKNNLDEGITAVYNVSSDAILKKLYELLGKNIQTSSENSTPNNPPID